MSEDKPETAQTRFDRQYITAGQIYASHRITRASLLGARNRGLLPAAIYVDGHVCIWERTPELEKTLADWLVALDARRGRGAAVA